jgi:hypothetical protein
MCVPSLAKADAPIGLVGTLSGDYANSDYSGGGGDSDTWGFNAAGAFGLGFNNQIGAEINGGYHNVSFNGPDADIWNIGGSIYWAPAFGRLGPSITYTSLDFGGGFGAHATTYGVFGEFFVSPYITLGIKGGGMDSGGSGFAGNDDSGAYVGGALTGYVVPNLAINGAIDYLDFDFGHLTSYGVSAEYLFSQMLPVSVFGGYTRSDLSNNLGDVDTWFIGLKFYTSGTGAPLVEHHRTETLGSIGTVTGLQFAF